MIRRHPQVERVVCGHVHRPMTRRFAGTPHRLAAVNYDGQRWLREAVPPPAFHPR